MAFKRVIIRRVGPLSWLLEAMSKSLLFIVAIAISYVLVGCASNKLVLPTSMYKVELVKTPPSSVSIAIVPESIVETDAVTREQFLSAWRDQAKIACRGAFTGEPTEQIDLSAGDGFRTTTTTLPSGEIQTVSTRAPSHSIKLIKVFGVANCKKSRAGL